jgi:hypothetical protein
MGSRIVDARAETIGSTVRARTEAMTPEDVQQYVERIRENALDDEAAHGMEDALWADVLEAIASGAAEEPAALARAALATLDIEFARWCA